MFKSLLAGLLLALLLLPVGGAAGLRAQSDSAAIAARLVDYERVTRAMDIDSVLNFIDPKLFELVPRDMMRAQFEQTLFDTNMVMSFDAFTVDQISPSITHDAVDYALVDYRGAMSMTMASAEYREPDFFGMMSGMIAAQFGADKVAIDTVAYRLDIQTDKSLVAIRRPGDPDWYFIEYQEGQRELMGAIVPEEAWRKLKPE